MSESFGPQESFDQGITQDGDGFDVVRAMTTGEVTTGGNGFGRLALVVTMAVVAALGGFAFRNALSQPGGAETPQEAADMLFQSVADQDLLGVAEIMLPSERESLIEPSIAILAELGRLGLLSDDVVDGQEGGPDISGFEVSIPPVGQPGALTYEVTPIGARDDLQWVTVTGGSMEITYDPQAFSQGLGGRLAEWLDETIDDDELEVQTETVDLKEAYHEDEALEFAVVEEDGAFYVSLYYTIAGLANDGQAPDFAAVPTPAGAETPEAALEELVRRLVDLDAEGVLTIMDPEEFRAAYDYWGSYSPDMVRDLEEALDEAAAAGVSWEIVSVEASSSELNGRTAAWLEAVSFRVTSDAEELPVDALISLDSAGLSIEGTAFGEPMNLSFDGEVLKGSATIEGEDFAVEMNLPTFEGWYLFAGQRVEVSRDGDCVVTTFDGELSELCGGDLVFLDPNNFFDFQQEFEPQFGGTGYSGLTVVERDGRWYISGFPTMAYAIVDVLSAMDQEEFDSLIDSYEELYESTIGTGSF